MKGWFPRFALAALMTMVVATTAFAAATTYKIDSAHSEVAFKVRHIFTKVPGRFTQFEGEISFDQDQLKNSSVNVTIQAPSIFTDNEKRDGHLKTEDFFHVEKYPTLTFKSTKVKKGKGDKLQIEGDLTIRGVTKKVTLDAEFLGQGVITVGGNPMGDRAGFEASTTIKRKDFGIVWNRTLDKGGVMVGEDVDIIINIEAIHMEMKKS